MEEDRPFTDHDSRSAWNEAADAWETFVETGQDYYRHVIHGPALLEICEPLQGQEVLDLGCGPGYFSRQMAKRGARLVAVDLAEEQVAHALRHEAEEPLGIEYHIMPAAQVTEQFADRRFDLVTACMALHDMAEPQAVLISAFDVLRPGGRLAFSTPHPCTDTPFREWERGDSTDHGYLKINHYFDTGPTVLRWRMGRLTYHWDSPYWRHTISEWSAMIAAAGFLIRRLHEPRPTAEQVMQNLHLEDAYRLPAFLIFDLLKPGEGSHSAPGA
jgi:2-polyprenyl-3-methyl-5-hydroxy-6-metoxy-1,4-benzoquinol methylase